MRVGGIGYVELMRVGGDRVRRAHEGRRGGLRTEMAKNEAAWALQQNSRNVRRGGKGGCKQDEEQKCEEGRM